MNIDIGIVNYNGGIYLRKCVESILSQKNTVLRAFVYDNASTDGSLNSIAEFDRVHVINGTENKGYAFACNRLIEAMDCKIVAIANMDLQFDPFWSEQICKAFEEHPEISSVASLVLEKSDPITVNFAGVGFFPDLHPQSIHSGKKPEDIPCLPVQVFGAYGAVMAFRRDVFSKIGFFDEDYFLFYEETEFYWRMNLYNLKTIFWPAARVLHYRSLVTRRFSPLKLFYSERNRIYTGLKILPFGRYFSLFFWSLYRFNYMRKLTDSSQKKKMNENGASLIRIIWTIISAWFSAMCKISKIMKKRKKLWMQSGAVPKDSLKILNKYRIPWSSVSLK